MEYTRLNSVFESMQKLCMQLDFKGFFQRQNQDTPLVFLPLAFQEVY